MKHIKDFREAMENRPLRSSVGEVVFDYFKIMERGDLDAAREYLKAWVGGDSGRKAGILFTLERFKASRQVLDATRDLLGEM